MMPGVGSWGTGVTDDERRAAREPIGQAELKSDPDFADALIVTMPGGKNPFRVNDKQWSAIERRLNRAEMTVGSSE
jgi:hypothetical protein